MTRALPNLLFSLLAGVLLSFSGASAEPASPADGPAAIDVGGCVMPEVPMFGLPVGTDAPDFTATSIGDLPVTLQRDLLTDGDWVVLVTYRGGWCPYCNTQLHALRDINDAIEERNARLVAISVDVPDRAMNTTAEQDLPFLVLSDPSAQMFRDYNIVNVIPDETYLKYRDEYKFDIEEWSGEDHHIVTHPAVIIIDPAGVIRFFHVNEDYKLRLTNDEVLAALASVQQPMEKSPVE